MNAENVLDRIWAAHELSQKKGRKIVEYILLNAAKNDSFWGVRKEASIAYGKLKPKITNEDYSWLISEKIVLPMIFKDKDDVKSSRNRLNQNPEKQIFLHPHHRLVL